MYMSITCLFLVCVHGFSSIMTHFKRHRNKAGVPSLSTEIAGSSGPRSDDVDWQHQNLTVDSCDEKRSQNDGNIKSLQGDTVAQWLQRWRLTARRFWVWFRVRAFLSGVCMFSLRVRGFSRFSGFPGFLPRSKKRGRNPRVWMEIFPHLVLSCGETQGVTPGGGRGVP